MSPCYVYEAGIEFEEDGADDESKKGEFGKNS